MALRKLSILNGLLVVDHVNPSGNRKEVKLSHGYRKYFVTMLVNSKISETIISKLTGHTIPNSMGLLQIYSKQTEDQMLKEYLKAVDNLTINPENRLLRKVEKLEVEASQLQWLQVAVQRLEAKIK